MEINNKLRIIKTKIENKEYDKILEFLSKENTIKGVDYDFNFEVAKIFFMMLLRMLSFLCYTINTIKSQ